MQADAVRSIQAATGDLISPPIWADFMKVDWNNAIRLDLPGTRAALERWGIDLHEGLRLLLYEDDGSTEAPEDLMAVGTVMFDSEEDRWVAGDWEPCFHSSDLDAESQRLWDQHRAR